jgi:hypothetical protein
MPALIRFFYAFLLCCCFATACAQTPLCLSTDAVTKAVDFRGDELNKYLHLDKYKIILFGEQHNGSFDPEIKYHLITDLNRRTGNRHVFMEVGVANAWHYNRYLETGDMADLYTDPAKSGHTPYALFWQRLYAYNRSLPEKQKIVIHGVDFERTDVFATLKQLVPVAKPVPASLRPVMDTITTHLSDPPLAMWRMINNKFVLYDNSGFVKTLRYIQTQLLAHAEDAESYFGANYPVVRDIASNTAPVEVAPKRRNKAMFAAMQRIVEDQKIDRFIGFFGFFGNQHTTYEVASSLANAAKQLKGVGAGDILNIAEFAYNLKSTDTAFRVKRFHETVALNKGCKATVIPAGAVPGYKRNADFVVIANVTEEWRVGETGECLRCDVIKGQCFTF